MSDHQLQVNEGRNSVNWLGNVSSVLILVVLIAIAFLMYSLNRKLETFGQMTPLPDATQATFASANQQPAPIVSAPMATPVAAAPAVRRTAARPASNRNYTGATPDSASAIPSRPTPVVAAPAPPAYVPEYTAPYPVAVAPAPPVARTQMASLPAGTILTVRMISSVSSDASRPGDRFTASLDEPVYANGVVAVPSGATVEGKVVSADQAGRVSGVSELSVQLDRLQLPSGASVSLATDVLSRQGETSRRSDATKVGVGAAIGAAIGAIGGGRRGAGIGAATGAGAGTAGVLLTRGKPVILSPETRLSFSLAAPVQFEVGSGYGSYSQSSSVVGPTNMAPAWPAANADQNDPFDGQRPRLRRRTEFN
jgi:hypothetical protein